MVVKAFVKSITPFCWANGEIELFDGTLEIMQVVCFCVSMVLFHCHSSISSASCDRDISAFSAFMGLIIYNSV